MKKLLLGNEAVARGLYEAGCRVASSYPGTPSTEITEVISKYDEITSEWAPNEKVAAEVAFGAAVAGARSFCGMKHVLPRMPTSSRLVRRVMPIRLSRRLLSRCSRWLTV